MSVAAALAFIGAVRDDAVLREQIAALPRGAGLAGACEIGAEQGYGFSAEDLNAAFRVEWTMRWAHYGVPQNHRD